MHNWKWYAQSSSTFYTAEYFQKFNNKNKQYPLNSKEYISTDFINVDNVGPNGINKYGITLTNPNSQTNLADFSISCNSQSDFIYTTPNFRYTYTIRFDFEYIDKNKTAIMASYNNLAQYIDKTKKQRTESNLKIEDIFIHKFGHSDIKLSTEPQAKTMIHDGYSIGYKYQLNFKNGKTAIVQVRGNLDFDSRTPRFTIHIQPNFDCKCKVTLITNDINITDIKKTVEIEKNQSKTINIGSNKSENSYIPKEETTYIKDQQLKEELYKISKFIDWRFLPNKYKINWAEDTSNDIMNKYLEISDYIYNRKGVVVANQFMSVMQNDDIIYYHNNNYDGYIKLLFPYTPTYSFAKEQIITYHVDQTSITIDIIWGSLTSTARIVASEFKLPEINLTFEERESGSISFIIESDLPLKGLKDNRLESPNIYLYHETAHFTTIP